MMDTGTYQVTVTRRAADIRAAQQLRHDIFAGEFGAITPGPVGLDADEFDAACDHVVDEAVQLHGGFGYLRDAEVERHYRDSRVLGIGGGTTEVMAELAARRLGFTS